MRKVMKETMDSQLTAIREEVTEHGNKINAVETRTASLEEKTVGVERSVADLRGDLESLRRDGGTTTSSSAGWSASGSSSRFMPSFFEVKGYCDFDKRTTEGATRMETKVWLEKVKSRVAAQDVELAAAIGDVETRGPRSSTFKVHVHTPRLTMDLVWAVKSILKEDEALGRLGMLLVNARSPFVVAERSQTAQARVKIIGSYMSALRTLAAKTDEPATAEGVRGGAVEVDWKTGEVGFRFGNGATLLVVTISWRLETSWVEAALTKLRTTEAELRGLSR